MKLRLGTQDFQTAAPGIFQKAAIALDNAHRYDDVLVSSVITRQDDVKQITDRWAIS